jgi:hypothetical protein
MFNLFYSVDDRVLCGLQKTADAMALSATEVVAAKKSVIDLHGEWWANQLLSYNGPYLSRINDAVRSGNVIGSVPSNFLVPYPITQWVLQINYGIYGVNGPPVIPHFDTPDYVCVCLLEDFPVGFGGELHTKCGQKVVLSKAGECVVINGSQVEHWVTNNTNPHVVRKTLVISLMDDKKKIIKLDHVGYPRVDVIKDWINWTVRTKSLSYTDIVTTLISKL